MTPLLKLATALDRCDTERHKVNFIKNNPAVVVSAFASSHLENPTAEDVMQILFRKHRCRILNSTGALICQTLQAAAKAA